MKNLFIIIVIIIAVLLITPKYIASQVESNLTQTIDTINQQSGLSIELKDFEDNWFNSTAILQVALLLPEETTGDSAPAVQQFIPLEFQAQHGLVLTQSESFIGLLSWQLTLTGEDFRNDINWPSDIPLCTVRGTLQITGSGTVADQCSAFSVQDEEVAVDFKGYKGSGDFSTSGLSYAGKSTGFSIKGNNVDFNSADFNIDLAMQGNILDALVGKLLDTQMGISFAELSASQTTADSQVDFSLNKLGLATTTSVDEDSGTSNITLTYSVNNIDAGGYQASDLVLATEFNNISIALVDKYTQIAGTLESNDQAAITAAFDDIVQNELLAALKYSPEANITDFHGTLPQGQFSLTMFNAVEGVETLPVPLENQVFWMQHINSEAKLSGDRKVFEFLASHYLTDQLMQNPQALESMTPEQISAYVEQQTPAMLDSFIEQGMATQEQQKITTSFALNKGEITVNGKPLPIEPAQ